MSTLYQTRVTATGGRNGSIVSEDGLLALDLALPASLGGKENATNPEQLFAGGYAACFGNAVLHVSRQTRAGMKDGDVEVVATVGIGPDGAAFRLSVALEVTITGLDQAAAEEIVRTAHTVCPYSNAVRGNIDVAITVKTR